MTPFWTELDTTSLNMLLVHECAVAGSSTACVLAVNGSTLSASNLGDSGFVLVRDGVATFQCPQQQHNFNFPFQLGSAGSMSDQPQAAMVSDCATCGCQLTPLALTGCVTTGSNVGHEQGVIETAVHYDTLATVWCTVHLHTGGGMKVVTANNTWLYPSAVVLAAQHCRLTWQNE